MAEENAHKTPDNRRGMAISMLVKKLVEKGVNKDAALEHAQSVRGGIYVALDPKAPILIRKIGGGLADLYPASFDDPIGALAEDLFKTIPDIEKLVAVQRREEAIAQLQEEKSRDPSNWL